MESVSYGGVVLTDLFEVIGIRKPYSHEAETVSVSGRDDLIVRDTRLRGPAVTLRFVAGPRTRAQLHEARRQIGSLLASREPKRLQFGDDGGLYYMALPNGTPDWAQFSRTGRMDVQFLVPSPAMYGTERVATVPSGSYVDITVDGTYPTRPTITASSAVRNSTSLVWGLVLDSAGYIHVETGSSSARSVTLDCEARTCRVSNSIRVPTLDSDWFEFAPGSHRVRMDNGTGAAVLRWQERWLA